VAIQLFNEAQALAKAASAAARSLPQKRPRVDVVHDLPTDAKICAADGSALERMGEEISGSDQERLV
jgi:hypothetical protein